MVKVENKFKEFFNKWNGKPCEVNDPSNLNQCMDLIYAWCDALGVTRDAVRHLYAYEVYTKPNDLTVKYFELVPNTALAVPKVGDIVVFKGGVAGHVSVANGKGDTNTFESFDQNWNTTSDDYNNKCMTIIHVYDNVLGFLRFRTEPTPEITEQTLLPIIDASGHQMEVQAVRSKLADQDRRIAVLLTEKDELFRKVDQQQLQMISLNKQITDLLKEIEILKEIPNLALEKLQKIHDVLYGSGWWWVKFSKIKALLPKQP